jgi:hypothetical protein
MCLEIKDEGKKEKYFIKVKYIKNYLVKITKSIFRE